ncbi:MAG TPA: FtsL-like putative cell division protein [Cyclobacteriaceae bacterium]|nr:FtsL-like putative cell division protein [Cyclobacteriaceae bacterium]
MFASKQSEVARRVKAIGLKESLNPPYKIVVEEGEY